MTPTTMTGLRYLIRDAISGSDAIMAWAGINYDREVSVFVGLDERDPPRSDQYPAVHILPTSRGGDMTPGDDTYTVSIISGVHDESPMVLVPGTDHVYEMQGPVRLEEFVDLIVAELRDVGADDLFLRGVSVEYETVEFFPFFLAEITAIFDRPLEPGHYT